MAFVPNKIKVAEEITKDYIEFESEIIRMISNNDGNYSFYIHHNGIDIKAEGNTFLFKDVIDNNLKFKFYGYIEDNKMTVLKISLIPHLQTIERFLISFIGINEEYCTFDKIDPMLFILDLTQFKNNIKNTFIPDKKIIFDNINKYFLIDDIINFLLAYEIDEKTSSNIFNYYNSSSNIGILDYEKLNSFKKNFLKSPYFLTDLPFIKFSLIDYIGINKLNIPKNDIIRLRYLMKTELFDYITKNGNTFIFFDDFVSKFNRQFSNLSQAVEIGIEYKDIIVFSIDYEGSIKKCITVSTLYRSEVNIKNKLLDINNDKHTIGSEYKNLIDELLKKEENFLTKNQKDTIKSLLNGKVSILTGGPGTGKTTIIKYITFILDNIGIKYCLLSPTGKAASRVAEVTNKDAKTIHRAFGINSFGIYEGNKKDEEFYIIDESSMIDNNVFEIFISNIPKTSQIILVGDKDQLPPVEYGNVFKELINSNKFQVSILTKIHRTKNGSNIPIIAKKINESKNIECNNDYLEQDFSFISANSDDEILEKMSIIIYQLINNNKYKSQDIQVLTPQNKTLLGVKNLNISLKEIFNPSLSKKFDLKLFSSNDKVIQTKNNYEKNVYNGEIGIVKEYDLINEVLTIQFNNRIVSFNSLSDLELAYAITIHKSQGSESPVVIIPISKSHSFMLNKNLIYTGVTRGKEKVILIGDLELFNKSIKKINQNQKLTLISYLLNR